MQVHIFQIALEDRYFAPSSDGVANSAISLPPEVLALDRRALLSSCWSAVKAMSSHFLNLPARLLFRLPYPSWLQLGHSLTIQAKILEVEDETCKSFRESIMEDLRPTVLSLCQRLRDLIKQGSQFVPPRRPPDEVHLLLETLEDHTRQMGRKQAVFGDEPTGSDSSLAAFLPADEGTEVSDIFLTQEPFEPGPMFDFLIFDGEPWQQ